MLSNGTFAIVDVILVRIFMSVCKEELKLFHELLNSFCKIVIPFEIPSLQLTCFAT